jgi:hypothetical protein
MTHDLNQENRLLSRTFRASFDKQLRRLIVEYDDVSYVAALLSTTTYRVYRRLNAAPNKAWWKKHKKERSLRRKKERNRRQYLRRLESGVTATRGRMVVIGGFLRVPVEDLAEHCTPEFGAQLLREQGFPEAWVTALWPDPGQT